MRKRAMGWPAFIGGLVLLGVGACSGESGGPVPSSGGPPIPLGELGDKLANTYCDAIGPCCSQAGLQYDKSACVTKLQTSLAKTIDAVNGGTVKYDANAAGDCLAGFSSVVDNCKFDGPTPDACNRTFNGTVADGGNCTISNECLKPPGGRATCTSGKCVTHAKGTSGTACAETCTQSGQVTICYGSGGSGALCLTNDGLYCNGTTQKCTAIGKIGDSCDGSDASCTPDAYCESSTCAARKNIGDSCTFNGCVTGAYCANSSCQAQKPLGSTCTSSDECADGHCSSGTCKTDNIDLSLICQ